MATGIDPLWGEAAGALLCAAAGLVAGVRTARWAWPRWLFGYVVPVACILGVGAARRSDAVAALAPVEWLLARRGDFWVLAVALPMTIASLVPHVAAARLRGLLVLLGVVVSVPYFVLPFVQPAWNAAYFRDLKTFVTRDGVCMQSREFTCGPAAAVTVLRRMGLPADEGPLALAMRTSGSAGTPSAVLAFQLNALYGGRGVRADCRVFKGLDELAAAGPVIVSLKHVVMIDHFVAVLDIGPCTVAIGDPLQGRRVLTHAEFLALWRYSGVVVARHG